MTGKREEYVARAAARHTRPRLSLATPYSNTLYSRFVVHCVDCERRGVLLFVLLLLMDVAQFEQNYLSNRLKNILL